MVHQRTTAPQCCAGQLAVASFVRASAIAAAAIGLRSDAGPDGRGARFTLNFGER
jgi:hypothetical protein